ncbi:hypothetical protein TSOC_003764 [Tetrabaena socialis]|uniref:Uncharacterized protein n=1 Tax=Tetrabaena socialis TaxID=47790 RepID=A0A2J8AAQ4_9CHLO|nr:hypothetical protein TSOC_003764 [Tetrabaena socialis]|eukprot:PNH09609.1 hypothetical protein TSOC_003764 [Tetrabaena socialis]
MVFKGLMYNTVVAVKIIPSAEEPGDSAPAALTAPPAPPAYSPDLQQRPQQAAPAQGGLSQQQRQLYLTTPMAGGGPGWGHARGGLVSRGGVADSAAAAPAAAAAAAAPRSDIDLIDLLEDSGDEG